MDGERGDKAPNMDRRVSSMFSSVSSMFSSVSRQVQFLLDHNCLLINEINLNHESKIPEGLTRNVTLIRQLNSNISKVVELYASLSSNFSDVFENLQEVNSEQINSTSRPVSNSSGCSMPGAAATQPSGQNPPKKPRVVQALPAVTANVNRQYLTKRNTPEPQLDLLDLNYR